MSNGYPQPASENGFPTNDQAGQEQVDVLQPLFIDVGHVVADQPVHVQANAEAHQMLLLQEAPAPINGHDPPPPARDSPPVLEAQNSLEVSDYSTASTYLLASSASGPRDTSTPGPSTGSAAQTVQSQAKSSREALEESSEVSELTSSSGQEDDLRRRSREENIRRRDEEVDRGRRPDSDCDGREQRGEALETTRLLSSRSSSGFLRRLRACMDLRHRGCWMGAIALVSGSLFLLWHAEIIPTSVLVASFVLTILIVLIPIILSYRRFWL